ncbi:choice-of-anchor P family protein [Spirillospora albida]|uniref:choice-of-anchor P family protein n=1 Tax=Spirillospora albida TaxID=58123 RepID=UPI0004C04E5B|nr:choice-of-anchor P family protein [Spirillospora albida]
MRIARLAAASLLAAAGGGLALGAAPAAADGGPGASAYGLTATGPAAVPPAPAVSSSSGTVGKRLLRTPRTKLLSASALDVRAAANRSRSRAAGVSVPMARLTAAAVSAACTNGTGSARLAGAVVGGRRLASAPPPNTTVPADIEGLGRVALVLNRQQRLPDGRLSVTAVELTLPVKNTQVRIASATCGRGPAGGHEGGGGAEAPAPTPVRRDLPVTG